MKIIVESYKKTGPSQCHRCQRFGHGSLNCGHAPRCVKCACTHLTNECVKPRDQAPTCSNCNGAHTANYRGCPSYTEIISSVSKNKLHPSVPTPIQLASPPVQPPLVSPPNHKNPTHLNYANATKSKSTIKTETVITLLFELLSAISSADESKTIISTTVSSIISILKHSHE